MGNYVESKKAEAKAINIVQLVLSFEKQQFDYLLHSDK